MFISRLELSGFKSFASKTSLDFRPGVMAVVGPNGCGKTNIVDAVRWVLGEQRTGALRAERMESVIFNGTAKRRPVGMAEVTLTVENDKGVLPSAYTQVEITRRLFRSGESEYLINRTASRLRDIQDLFVDTGFGHSTYSIIELSMVEGIISGPSEARRALFEEAAGVAKFKSRRNAAERRLESTREALERLKDVYGEVEKSYQTLKRQSNRARRYQSLSRALQLRLIADLSRERLSIVSRRLPIETRLSEIERLLIETEAVSSKLSTELLTLEAAEINLDGKVGRTQDSAKRVERREAELDGELALLNQRGKQLASDSEGSIRRSGELKSQLETASREVVAASTEAEKLTGMVASLDVTGKQLSATSTDLASKVLDVRKSFEELQLQEAELARKVSTESAIARRSAEERTRIQESLRNATERGDELARRKKDLDLKIQLADAGLADAQVRVESSAKERETSSLQVDETRKRVAITRSVFLETRTEYETANRNLSAHQSRGAFLTGLPKSIQASSADKSLLTLAARIECKPEHRAAIAAAIRPILEAIDASDLSAAVNMALGLKRGEAVVLRVPRDRQPVRKREDCPVGVTPLPDLILGSGALESFLRGRVADACLVDKGESLSNHAGWAANAGIRLVTASGEMLDPDGIFYAGSVDPEGYRVGWQSTLHDLQATQAKAEKAALLAVDAHKKAESELATAESRLQQVRQNLQRQEDELASNRRQSAALAAEMQQVKARLTETEAELSRLRDALTDLPVIDPNDAESLQKLASEHEAVKIARQSARESLDSLETGQRRLNQDITLNASEVARTGERLNQAKLRHLTAESLIATATRQLAELEAKSAGIIEEQRRVKQAAENLEAQISLIRREKDELTVALDAAKKQKTEHVQRKQVVNNDLKQAQEASRRMTEERNRLELEGVSGKERLREIDRRLLEDAGTQPESILPETPANAEAELVTLEMNDLALEQIKLRIQSLGPVNMLALEELEQVEERYRFLTDQRKDLEGGVELLTETIDRINHEARRRFRETFDQVDANFQKLFKTLFEGGEARITLEGGDPLESDIKIWATPSGKKLQGLPMLSGGEKALTAISLLFAIYMVRPSPFCILDEVDAPLDDANVGRYNRLIREFSVNTQFMIVTHNKRSMEAADNLFGVTLSEDGSSQLVSVQLKSGETPTAEVEKKQ